QRCDGRATRGCVSILRGAEPSNVADGYRIHDNPRVPVSQVISLGIGPRPSFVRMALRHPSDCEFGGLCVNWMCTLDRIGPAQFSPQQLVTCPQISESLQRKS